MLILHFFSRCRKMWSQAESLDRLVSLSILDSASRADLPPKSTEDPLICKYVPNVREVCTYAVRCLSRSFLGSFLINYFSSLLHSVEHRRFPLVSALRSFFVVVKEQWERHKNETSSARLPDNATSFRTQTRLPKRKGKALISTDMQTNLLQTYGSAAVVWLQG